VVVAPSSERRSLHGSDMCNGCDFGTAACGERRAALAFTEKTALGQQVEDRVLVVLLAQSARTLRSKERARPPRRHGVLDGVQRFKRSIRCID
jgi:hypothetical protein